MKTSIKRYIKKIKKLFRLTEKDKKIKEILKYYKDNNDKEKQEIITQIKKTRSLDMIHFKGKKEFIKSLKVEAGYDEQHEMYYVVHNNKKMYLNKNFTNQQDAISYYKGLLVEQHPDSPHNYLTEQFNFDNVRCLIDCGGAEGIFTLDNIEKIEKAYIFECDEKWIKALKLTFSSYKNVEIIKKFVSNINNEKNITLDYFQENFLGGGKIDFIKMDIESSEVTALEGAKNILKNNEKLKLVVCSYHTPTAEEEILKKLENFKIVKSKGYILCPFEFVNGNCNYGINNLKPPYFSRGVIKAEKLNKKVKVALITGITGQDGYFLSKLLLEKGYEVHGLARKIPESTKEIEYIDISEKLKINQHKQIIIHYGDMTDSSNLTRIIKKIEPDEIYNLAGVSNVKVSFDVPENTADSVAIGVLRILEIIKNLDLITKTKFYQASTSELFGNTLESPQNEMTKFNPKSPYAIAKLYSYYLIKYYREAYGMFAVNGILFNHESERRGKEFVTRKITLAAVKISKGFQEKLYLGNLEAKRDWGYAKDYVECMWLMLQHNKAEDFIIATGEQHTVREFCEIAFKEVGIEIEWQGKGINEKGICKNSKKTIIEVSKEYFRPLEVNATVGNPKKAQDELGWNPRKTSFEQLIKIMIKHDLKLFEKRNEVL